MLISPLIGGRLLLALPEPEMASGSTLNLVSIFGAYSHSILC
jgi:hypothetical protein